MDIKLLKDEAQKEINFAQDLKTLDEIWRKYFGKKGEIKKVLENLKNLPREKRKKIGQEINKTKNELEALALKKRKELQDAIRESQTEQIDVTLPGKKIELGHLHPLTRVLLDCQEIFEKMGFQVVEGPEVENEWYNFDALNFPPDHPARDMQDTFFIKQKDREELKAKERLLLRTHTSPVQVRFMEKHNPPLRIVVPGRVFRSEATDASHEVQFHHLEGLMVGENVSMANLKAVLMEFTKNFFGRKIELRFRPSFFPFTEPSIEVDAKLKGKWIELLGAGMVHPNVLKSAGLNSNPPAGRWQGFAFGLGIDRFCMIKYKIDDIRLFYNGNLDLVKQF